MCPNTCHPCVRSQHSACRRHGERDGTHCFTRKTSGIVRSETGRDRIETGATASAACPTKFRRRLHLSNLAGRDTLFHRADPGEFAPSHSPPSSIERGGTASPRGPKLDRPPPASRSAGGGDPFSHKGEKDPHQRDAASSRRDKKFIPGGVGTLSFDRGLRSWRYRLALPRKPR
jgi:hypothetical protein